jgi:hypothetical protein
MERTVGVDVFGAGAWYREKENVDTHKGQNKQWVSTIFHDFPFVLPQTGYGLSGRNYTMDGDGKTLPAQQIPSTYDRVNLLSDWVENNRAPGKSVTVTAGERSLAMCAYPAYPKYVGGLQGASTSYVCTAK